MAYNLRNRSFLKLLDFDPKEIRFLLDLSMDLKKAKYSGTEQKRLKERILLLFLRKHQPEQGVLLKWLLWIRVLMLPIWDPPDRR